MAHYKEVITKSGPIPPSIRAIARSIIKGDPPLEAILRDYSEFGIILLHMGIYAKVDRRMGDGKRLGTTLRAMRYLNRKATQEGA